MAEEANDVAAAEITPEQFDGEKQDSPKAESSPAEEAKAEKPEVAEEPEKEPQDTETEGEPESQEAEETETEKPHSKAEERKAELNTEIRDLVSQRNSLRDEVTKANSEVYQPATEDELEDQGYNPTDAKVEALRQQVEMRDYNEKVADAQLTISTESQRVLDDFPMFNEDSSEYDQELAQEAAELVKANLQFDQNTGQITGSNASIYQLYKTLARASGISATKGQIKGQQDTEKMLANADSPSSKTAAKAKADPLTELWKEDL